MTNEDLEEYLREIGHDVDTIVGADQRPYIVVRDYHITTGPLAGKTSDVAIERTSTVPYVFPSAIHTRPALVPMDIQRYNTQASNIGSGWQYWSRKLRKPPTPQRVVAHIATIFSNPLSPK